MNGPPRAQDHILVDQGRDDGTDDRPDPVDEIILPEATSQSWAEGACRIHRCARQRSAHEDIDQHRQANAKATDFWCSWIDGGSEDRQQQEERQDRLNENSSGSSPHWGRSFDFGGWSLSTARWAVPLASYSFARF